MSVEDPEPTGAHGHGHGSVDRSALVMRALLVTLVLNASYLVVEAGAGWWSGSLALLSDAAHMLGDVAALLLAYGAAHLATRSGSPNHTFGLRRAEVIGALLNGLILLGAVAWIFVEAVERLLNGAPEVAGPVVLAVATIGLFVNLGSAWYLSRSDKDNLGVRGALAHMLADALGSVGAMVAAVLVMAGVPGADAVVSVLIGALVLVGTWGVLRDSTRVLLQFPPRDLQVDSVRGALAAVDGLADVHDLHLWSLDGQSGVLTAHLVLVDPQRWQAVLAEARRTLIEDLGIAHVTLQVEVAGSCHGDACPALARAPEIHHGHGH